MIFGQVVLLMKHQINQVEMKVMNLNYMREGTYVKFGYELKVDK